MVLCCLPLCCVLTFAYLNHRRSQHAITKFIALLQLSNNGVGRASAVLFKDNGFVLVGVELASEGLDWRHSFALDHALQFLGYQLKSPIPRCCGDVWSYAAYCSL